MLTTYTAEILGPQDAPDYFADSARAYCPLSLRGDTAGVLTGGDDLISYSHDTWQSYLSDGYTEYIEVEVPEPVYLQSITIGENRGMFSIVKIKAFDAVSSLWQILWEGDADPDSWAWFKDTNQYHQFTPSPLCETTFATSVIRIEMDTYTIVDWNELDYVKVIGATRLKAGVLKAAVMTQTSQVVYVPDPDFAGVDRFRFKGCDCAFSSMRVSEEATVTISVGAVNDAPIVNDFQIEIQCVSGILETVTLQSVDIDTSATSLNYSIGSLPDGATLYDAVTGEMITSVPASLLGTDVQIMADYLMNEPPSSFTFSFFVTDDDGATSASVALVTATCLATQCIGGMVFSVGEQACVDCPEGTFASESAVRSSCDACVAGKFAAKKGSSSCGSCANGRVALAPGSASCSVCPAGATCDDVTTVTVNPGMWRTSANPLHMYECPFGSRACIGGNTTAKLCASGYSGVLCGICESGVTRGLMVACMIVWRHTYHNCVTCITHPGYFLGRAQAHQACKPCGKPLSWIRSVLYAAAILTCTAGLGVAAIKTGATKITRRYYSIGKERGKWLLHTVQIISSFSSVSETTGSRQSVSEPAASFVQLLSLSNVEIFSLWPSFPCSIPNNSFYTQLVFKTTVLPLAPIVLVWMYFLRGKYLGGGLAFHTAAKMPAKYTLYWVDLVLPTISTTIAQVSDNAAPLVTCY